MGTGAHLDGVSFPHLPEIIEPGLLWEEREREREVLGGGWGTNGARHRRVQYLHPL